MLKRKSDFFWIFYLTDMLIRQKRVRNVFLSFFLTLGKTCARPGGYLLPRADSPHRKQTDCVYRRQPAKKIAGGCVTRTYQKLVRAPEPCG